MIAWAGRRPAGTVNEFQAAALSADTGVAFFDDRTQSAGPARHTLADKIFHGREDELCQCCHKDMEGLPGALGPVLNHITCATRLHQQGPGPSRHCFSDHRTPVARWRQAGCMGRGDLTNAEWD
ncbi:hypothetical protein ACFXPV_38895, partial [Streptomyces sp. NPDC059118]|uniref:hypothetical protein n=1 Tax=unclassified Streptomyces TaxID=2593676 RepID=UPI0036B785A9